MSAAFAVSAERPGEKLGVVALRGEVDIYTAPRFKESLLALLDDGVSDIVVDLGEVEFIDSTALGVLIGGVRRVNAAGGSMALVVGTRPVQRVLSITGLDKVFSIHPTREAALAALR